jgi:hypothetical protein
MGIIEKTILRLRGDKSPVGDLCDEILFDKRFPFGQSNIAVKEYLEQYKDQFPAFNVEVDTILSSVVV